MDEKDFYKEGLKFTCKQCSMCCGHSPGFVYLSKIDLDKLCNFLKMSGKDFAKKYCRWAGYYEGKEVLALKEMKNYNCILWNNGCSAYEARPVQCATWPFWTWMIENKDSWNECAKDCQGMNKGRLWSKEEIEENSKKYTENIPLEKEEFIRDYANGDIFFRLN